MLIGSPFSLSSPPRLESLRPTVFDSVPSAKLFVRFTLQTLSANRENRPNKAPVFSTTRALLENRESAISPVFNRFRTLAQKPGVALQQPPLQLPSSFPQGSDSTPTLYHASARPRHLTPLESILTKMRVPNSFRSNTYEISRGGGATASSRSILERHSALHQAPVTSRESPCLL